MPKINSIIDVKPKAQGLIDTKPKMHVVEGETVVHTDLRTVRKGEPMGLLLSLTYPVNITDFIAPRK